MTTSTAVHRANAKQIMADLNVINFRNILLHSHYL